MAKGFWFLNYVTTRRASDAETKQTLAPDEHNSLTQLFIGTDQPPGTNLSFVISCVALVRFTGVQTASTDAGTGSFFFDFEFFCELDEFETGGLVGGTITCEGLAAEITP